MCIDHEHLLAAAKLIDDLEAQHTREHDAFALGFRLGYGHGYDIGAAHAEREMTEAWAALARHLRGPTQAERLRAGYIPRDLTRPPALPYDMWTVEERARVRPDDLPPADRPTDDSGAAA